MKVVQCTALSWAFEELRRVSNTSFSRSNDEIVGRNEIDYVDNQGNLRTTTIGTGEGQVDPGLAQARLGADTSMVGKGVETYSNREIEMQKAFGYRVDRQLYKDLHNNNF